MTGPALFAAALALLAAAQLALALLLGRALKRLARHYPEDPS